MGTVLLCFRKSLIHQGLPSGYRSGCEVGTANIPSTYYLGRTKEPTGVGIEVPGLPEQLL